MSKYTFMAVAAQALKVLQQRYDRGDKSITIERLAEQAGVPRPTAEEVPPGTDLGRSWRSRKANFSGQLKLAVGDGEIEVTHPDNNDGIIYMHARPEFTTKFKRKLETWQLQQREMATKKARQQQAQEETPAGAAPPAAVRLSKRQLRELADMIIEGLRNRPPAA